MKIKPALKICLTILLSVFTIGCFTRGGKSPVSRGGLLYDNWWAFTDVDAPTADHPIWSTQSSNTRSGEATWRCKECHGWDYLGLDGAYGSGSHFTGFPSVLEISQVNSVEELVSSLNGSTNADHDFSSVLDDTAINELATFLKEGVVDMREYIDYDRKRAIGADLNNGKKVFEGTCNKCHDDDGKKLNFGDESDPIYLGTLANSNPWETLHKGRFGQPGEKMFSSIDWGSSIQDSVDVLGYMQTLPVQ